MGVRLRGGAGEVGEGGQGSGEVGQGVWHWEEPSERWEGRRLSMEAALQPCSRSRSTLNSQSRTSLVEANRNIQEINIDSGGHMAAGCGSGCVGSAWPG